MGDDSKQGKPGCLGHLALALLACILAGCLTCLYFAAIPQDISDIGGYRPVTGDPPSRNLRVVLKQSLERGHPLALTESELNRWLGRVVEGTQKGIFRDKVGISGVWIRLLDGHAEVIIERSVMGRPFTVSMFITIDQKQGECLLHGGQYHPEVSRPMRGGRIGRLVVPQGFLLLAKPSFESLAIACREEIRLAVEEMAEVRIERNRLILNPRESEDSKLSTF